MMASSSFDYSIKSKAKKPSLEANTKVPQKKGAWTPQEDNKLAEVIAVHGAKRWNSIAARSGLKRNGKSCRLRWFNYLRPNIKRGNISDQEEDLILRLHKLLGNRWSLIAGRLPGRTDNEIKNYWNSHLCKKMKQREMRNQIGFSFSTIREEDHKDEGVVMAMEENIPAAEAPLSEPTTMKETKIPAEESEPTIEENIIPNEQEESEEYSINMFDFDDKGLSDFFDEGPLNLEWVSQFLELN